MWKSSAGASLLGGGKWLRIGANSGLIPRSRGGRPDLLSGSALDGLRHRWRPETGPDRLLLGRGRSLGTGRQPGASPRNAARHRQPDHFGPPLIETPVGTTPGESAV